MANRILVDHRAGGAVQRSGEAAAAVIALAFSLLQRLVRRQGPAGDRRPD